MKRLVKLQVRNIFHNKLFYVCLGITALLSVGVSYIGSLFLKTDEVLKAMPAVLDVLSDGSGLIGMIFVTVFCTFDFTEGTTKNIVARGYSKVKLLFSKYIGSLIGVFSMVGIVSLITFLLHIKDGLGFQADTWMFLISYLFDIVAFTIFYATVSFILEKTSSAIIANMFAPNLIMVLFSIIDNNLKIHASKYWIENVLGVFTSKPTVGNMFFSVIMYLFYIALFSFIGTRIAKNKEIK